jgi:hypothetical protein
VAPTLKLGDGVTTNESGSAGDSYTHGSSVLSLLPACCQHSWLGTVPLHLREPRRNVSPVRASDGEDLLRQATPMLTSTSRGARRSQEPQRSVAVLPQCWP